jgi:hypothetical protein
MPLQASRRAFEDAETGHRAQIADGVLDRRFVDALHGRPLSIRGLANHMVHRRGKTPRTASR